ncbi:MAG: hypothetical protein J6K97_00225 [Clostridia bacterium]|nr:hypothetical protein [Clostridia bacterium]
MKGILKKIGKPLVLGFLVLDMLFTAAACNYDSMDGVALQEDGVVLMEVEENNYSKNEQILKIAEGINADMSYVKSDYSKMQYNEGEPIYVCFDEKMPEANRKKAIEALDYMFGIVGEIDSNYKYKIVDENMYAKLGDETKIYFEHDLESKDSKSKNEFLINSYGFNLDSSFYTKGLLQAFGLDDFSVSQIVQGDRVQGNTFNHGVIREKAGIITPNDYKCLLALYTPEIKYAPQEEDIIGWYNDKVQEYERMYYSRFAEGIQKAYGNGEIIEQRNFVWNSKKVFVDENLCYDWRVEVENDKYAFIIVDGEGNVLDSCRGEVSWNDGMAFLKDVKLKEGFTPGHDYHSYSGGYVDDIVLLKSEGFVRMLNGPTMNLAGVVMTPLNEVEAGL